MLDHTSYVCYRRLTVLPSLPSPYGPSPLRSGVRLRSNPTCGPLPPSECDLQLPFIESQCAAVPTDLCESATGAARAATGSDPYRL